ncbi:hypothetical protein GCM10009750_26070 [Agromyces salentinus]|uniref:Uncharacterized protein n=1 Tax=Agromyces salentinus TaxID=269421 RepID=A0ABN2MVG7_9MICO
MGDQLKKPKTKSIGARKTSVDSPPPRTQVRGLRVRVRVRTIGLGGLSGGGAAVAAGSAAASDALVIVIV